MTEFSSGQRRLTTLIYVFDPLGRTLLMKRAQSPNLGLYSPPGGKVAVDESPKECAARELLEETGIKISLDALTPVGLVTETGYLAPSDQWVMFLYKTTLPTVIDAPPVSPEGEFQWIPADAVFQLPIPDTDRAVLWERVVRGDYFEIHIRCENGKILSII
ncbi:MAG: NUDIX domain-containing protein [Planctomycetota bacterium]